MLKLRFTGLALLLCWFFGLLPAIGQTNDAPAGRTVYIFLAETCPISQYYALALKELHRDFAYENLRFIGVFPNSSSTPESIAAFKTKYGLPFDLRHDAEQQLTKTLQAEITPEAIVQDDLSGAILYRGRIDDSYYRVGKRRQVITSTDLRNALTELQQNKPVSLPKTTAVGCYITIMP